MTLLEIEELTWVPEGAERPIWQDVSFHVDSGEMVILKGPSGSGKSTLLKAIVGLDDISAGRRLFDGEEVTAENIRRFRNRVVYVHQTPVAIAPLVEQNLAFPRQIGADLSGDDHEPMTEEEQRQLLEQFGLPDLDWSRRFDALSVGERQRVAFVRCITVRPELLMLDEPTASLDPTNAHRIEEFVHHYLEQNPDRSVIWITHSEKQRRRLDARHIDISQWTPSGESPTEPDEESSTQ